MSDDFGKRRRLPQPDAPRRSSPGGPNNFNPWLITVVAAVVVIVGGWFIGQALAHAFGPSRQTAQNDLPTPTPVITPVASAQPSPTQAVTPAPSPSASPAASPSTQPAATATAAPTEAPTATPAPTPTPTIAPVRPTPTPYHAPAPVPTPRQTAVARTTLPVARKPETAASAAAAPSSGSGNAAAKTVRAYIDALRRGDPQSAAMYLGNGSPDEQFIDENTRINSVTSTPNGDGSYKVAVDMQTSAGEYYETFTVASTGNGTRILDKTAIKP